MTQLLAVKEVPLLQRFEGRSKQLKEWVILFVGLGNYQRVVSLGWSHCHESVSEHVFLPQHRVCLSLTPLRHLRLQILDGALLLNQGSVEVLVRGRG